MTGDGNTQQAGASPFDVTCANGSFYLCRKLQRGPQRKYHPEIHLFVRRWRQSNSI